MLQDRCSPEKLVSVLIPRQKWHPFPTAQERPGWESLPQSVRNARVYHGEKAAAADWPHLPASLFLDYARNGNRSRFEKQQGRRRRILNDLVVAECVEDDGRFLDPILDALWSTCEETYWGLPAHVGVQKAGVGLPDAQEPTVDLFAAETGALLAWTAYLLGPQLDNASPLVLRRITHEISRRILQPCLEREDLWWMGLRGEREVNNWNPWINSNWLACNLLLERDEPTRARAVRKSMRSLDAFIDGYGPDGGCDEGPGYWGRAGASLFDCLEILRSATGGAVDLFDEPLIGEMGRFIHRAHIHDRWFVNFADAAAINHPAPSVVFRYGQRINDHPMQQFAAYFAGLHDLEKNGPRGRLPRLLPALFSLQDLISTPPAQPLLRDVWLPDLQVMTARDAEGVAKGLFVAAKGGHNAESHNHNDVGQFIVFTDGRPVLIDAGVETYRRQTFSNRRYEIWTMQSAYHNLPSINGVHQAPGRRHAARNVRYEATEQHARLQIDIAPAWPEEAGVLAWNRSVTLERERRVVVEDAWELQEDPQNLTFHLLTPCEVTVAETSLTLAPRDLPDDRRTGEAHIEFDPDALNASVEPIPIEDSKLRGIWGEKLHRINLAAAAPQKKGTCRIQLTPA
jgi:hypothetical protein